MWNLSSLTPAEEAITSFTSLKKLFCGPSFNQWTNFGILLVAWLGFMHRSVYTKHEIQSYNTKFSRPTQNLVIQHKIQSYNKKFSRTTKNSVVRYKLKCSSFGRRTQIWSHDKKFVFCVSKP
jgi:hypothetical protein